MACAIGCDVGSQSLKGVLIGPDGKLLAQASEPYTLQFPRPGWAEQDPEAWFSALRAVISRLIGKAGVRADEVGTLGLASQVDGVVAVDGEGRALHPAIVWMDRRAEAQCAAIERRIDRRAVLELTGLNLDSSHAAAKMLWLRDEAPGVFGRAKGLLPPGSYLVRRLTGECVVDHSNASSTMLYDVRGRCWSPRMFEATGLDPQLLGRIASAGDVAGRLPPGVAAEVGLAPGARVIAGCGDEHAACLGAGVLAPGRICDIAGTAEPVATLAASPRIDETGLVETHGHADARWWLIENPGFVSGGSLTWLAGVLGWTSFEPAFAAAAQAPPASEGLIFLPCLSGAMTPAWNGKARGVFFGLSMKHGSGHLARAVIESCAYALRDILDRFVALGLGGEDVYVTGGGSKSELWRQVKADVTGRRVTAVRNAESTAIGAAMLAGVTEGVFGSLDEGAEALVEFGNVCEPRPQEAVVYEAGYEKYRRLYTTLEPLFE
ncbi:MAG: hypothetical protein HY235_17065 [Acidobacteria bacterium]|nr:hypothetical protein [Acidobacteriota bacterium]